ncbi:PREDICTED: protein HOTHEAD [Tarenaya hassleriana]|uniref:protein HOTHEAD n=1 Tax=Tarenaya hassleriana TaxID=28532 RepID=UPI00053C2DD0|nr:PREDICTED: protein HOTHEAD [Tarenaya hassleriana]
MALKLFLFALLLSLPPSLSSPPKGKGEERRFNPYRYTFIEKASSFSSPPSSSFASNGRDSSYDYIVIGGGTAGCPLAATLSRNFSVLVLERGGVPFSNANVSFLGNFHIGLADTSASSASQPFVSTDGVLNTRARVLGGGSCINAGFYSRADAGFIKRQGWNPKLVRESYPWVERQVVHRPKLTLWQKALRDGLLESGVRPFNGFTYDHMYGTKIGGTIFDRFGRRHTAAELLSYANPQKLRVLIYATVQKIIFDTSGKRPRAAGVVFKDENGNQHQVLLRNKPGSEVILSSGAIGSPQMLMLSGIGPRNELQRLKIPVVLVNEFVGQGMADNPMNTIVVPSMEPVEKSLIQTVGISRKGVYIEASSGFGQSAESIHTHYGIMSAESQQLLSTAVPPKERAPEAMQGPNTRKKKAFLEVFNGGFFLEKLAHPISTGHLSLVNTNVDDNPSVTFNYFSNPLDVQRCVEGVRLITKVVTSKRFLNYTRTEKLSVEKLLSLSTKANINLMPKHLNDSTSIAQFCKDTVITIWHYHGGCHVGKVVSNDRTVIGVDRLRVIDGSTFSESPGTNPQATVMMMGRYMGVKILRERLGKNAGV